MATLREEIEKTKRNYEERLYEHCTMDDITFFSKIGAWILKHDKPAFLDVILCQKEVDRIVDFFLDRCGFSFTVKEKKEIEKYWNDFFEEDKSTGFIRKGILSRQEVDALIKGVIDPMDEELREDFFEADFGTEPTDQDEINSFFEDVPEDKINQKKKIKKILKKLLKEIDKL